VKRLVSLPLSLARGIARDRALRRNALARLLAADAGLVFIGAVLLPRWLDDHPLVFLGYWAVTGWLCLTVILLATYDLLVTRR